MLLYKSCFLNSLFYSVSLCVAVSYVKFSSSIEWVCALCFFLLLMFTLNRGNVLFSLPSSLGSFLLFFSVSFYTS